MKNKSDSEDSDIDPELDLRSAQFNPLKALTSAKVWIPDKKAPVYDNLAQYEGAIRKQELLKNNPDGAGPSQSKRTAQKDGAGPSGRAGNKWLPEDLSTMARRFAPHQGLVKGRGKKARHTRNLLVNMEKEAAGPLGLIQRYKMEQTRVKIYIRNDQLITGYVTGLIQLYDKHWNLMLTDVFEVWKRRKLHHCHTAAFDIDEIDPDAQLELCVSRLRSLNIQIPTTTVKSLNRKFAECSRHIPQLMIRGEQIAVITPVRIEDDKT